jgi:hypothetical protein
MKGGKGYVTSPDNAVNISASGGREINYNESNTNIKVRSGSGGNKHDGGLWFPRNH